MFNNLFGRAKRSESEYIIVDTDNDRVRQDLVETAIGDGLVGTVREICCDICDIHALAAELRKPNKGRYHSMVRLLEMRTSKMTSEEKARFVQNATIITKRSPGDGHTDPTLDNRGEAP